MNRKVLVSICLVVIVIIIAYFSIRKPVADSLNQKGLSNYQENEYAIAEKYFKKSLLWKRNSSISIINLIKAQLAQEKIAEAREVLAKLIKLSPANAETYALEGQILVMENKFIDAIDILSLAIEKDGLLSYAYYYRGIARANLNDLDNAADDYLRARELDEGNIDILKEGAIVFSRLEDFETAIDNYNKLIELDPSNTDAFLKRGNFKMKIMDFEGAIPDFSSAIALDNKLAEAYFNRGKSYANTKAFEKAITDFNAASDLKYKVAGANYNSGLASLQLSQPENAKIYLNKCIKFDSESKHSANAYHLLGVMEMMQNRNDRALIYFNRSLEFDPENIDAYYNRGIAYGLLHMPQEALKDLNKCKQLGKNTADLYFALGVQKIGMNNFEEGCSDLKKASEMGYEQVSEMLTQYCKDY